MAEIVVKNSNVYVVDRNSQESLYDLIFSACSQHEAWDLDFLAIELKRALVHVEEQAIRSRYEEEKGL